MDEQIQTKLHQDFLFFIIIVLIIYFSFVGIFLCECPIEVQDMKMSDKCSSYIFWLHCVNKNVDGFLK